MARGNAGRHAGGHAGGHARGRMETANFELSFPLKAEYVSIARLTVSGIANRAGFDIDTIEDIKVSLSEICNRLIKGSRHAGEPCAVRFTLTGGGLEIRFSLPGAGVDAWFGADGQGDAESTLGLSLIELLMDEFVVNPNEGCVVYMKKNLDTVGQA